jgi:hypothetical protein
LVGLSTEETEVSGSERRREDGGFFGDEAVVEEEG